MAEGERIVKVDIGETMKAAYIDYSMYADCIISLMFPEISDLFVSMIYNLLGV